MRVRRLMPFLVLLALLFAPYGRVQAQPAVQQAPSMAMAGHCDPAPADAPTPAHKGSIDCMIACAATPALNAAAMPAMLPAEAAAPFTAVVAPIAGLNHAAEPPPPR